MASKSSTASSSNKSGSKSWATMVQAPVAGTANGNTTQSASSTPKVSSTANSKSVAPTKAASGSATATGNTSTSTASVPDSSVAAYTAKVEALQQGDKVAHRYTFINSLVALTGKEVKVELAGGSLLKGVLHAAALSDGMKHQFILKAVELLEAGNSAREFIPGSSIILEYSNIVSVQGKPTPVAKAATNEFKTDAATKAKDMSHLFGRELEGVSNAWLDPSTSTSLENSGNTGWDQFEANRRLFNVQSSYDENLYTKKLDVNKLSRDAFERAERIAREIEGNVAENVHLREERGQLNESEINEEAMYSGVIRENYPAPETGSWRNSGAQSGSGKSNAGRGAWDRKLQLDNAGRNSGANSKTAGSPSTSSNSYQPPGRRTGTASFADTSVAASPATRSGKTVAPPALAPPATSPVVASAASSAPKPSSSAPPGLIASPVKPVETASASTSGVSTAAVAEDASKKASTSATSANAAKTAANVAPTLSETVAEASVVEEDISKPPAPTPAPAPAPTSAPAASAATTLNANAAEFVPKFTAPVVVPPPPAATIPMGVVPGSTQYGGLPSSVIAPAPGNAGAYGYAQHQASTTGNPTGAAHFYPQSYQSMPQYNYAGSSFYPSAQPLSGPTSVAPPGTTVPASVAPSTPAPAVNGNNSVNTNSVSKASATSQPSTPSLAGMPPPPPSSISRESPSAKPMMSPQALATTVPPQTPPVYANNNNSNSSNNSSYQTFQPQGHHTPHTPTTAPGHHAHATSTTQQTPQQVPMNAPSSWQSQPQDIMNVGAQSFTPVQIAPQQYSYYQPQFYSGTPQMYDYQYYQPVMPNGAPVVASGGAQGAPWMIYDNAQSFVVTPGTTTTPGAMLSNRPTNASSGNTNVTSSPATNPMNGNTSNNVNITPNNNNNANNSNTNTPTNTPAYVDPNTYMMYQAYIPQGMVHHMQTQQVPMQAYTHFVQTPQGAQQQQQAGAGAPVQANALPYIPYPVAANGQQQQVQHLQMMPNNTGYAYPNPNVTGVHPVVGHNAGNMYNSYTPNNMMSANGGISGGDKRNRTSVGGRGGSGRGNNSGNNNNRGPRSYNTYNNNANVGNVNSNNTAPGIQAEHNASAAESS